MNVFIILLFFIGIYLVTLYVTKVNCPPAQIEYKYVPKQYSQDYSDPIYASLQYGELFRYAAPVNPDAAVSNILKTQA